MGLVVQRVPTSEMLKELEYLSCGNYYSPLVPGRGTAFSNVPIEIGTDTLCVFRQLSKLEEERCADMTRRTNAGERSDFILDEAVRFPMTEAVVKDTNYGRTLTQGMRSHLFRGESKLWPSSLPTLTRMLSGIADEGEKERARLVAFMRIASFGELLLKFEVMQRWLMAYDIDLLVEPLAQHYGLPTPMLDFIDDFDTALFFATCWFDPSAKDWRPLTDEKIAEPGGEFGVIFHLPRWQAENITILKHLDGKSSAGDSFTASPIGYQPFQRCHMQHGYGVRLDTNLPLQENKYFEKLRFRQSVELSREVFDIADGGRAVFPNEGLEEIFDVIDEIKTAWRFSSEEFEVGYIYAGGDALYGDKDHALAMLSAGECFGHKVEIEGERPCFSLSRQRRRKVDRKHEDFNIKKITGSDQFWTKPRLHPR